MPRRVERGGTTGRWSLSQVCVAAGVSRSVGRTAIRRGLLRPAGWRHTDVVVLAAAAALMSLPHPRGAQAAADRNTRAVIEVKAAIADDRICPATYLLASPTSTRLVFSGRESVADALGSFPAPTVVAVVPLGYFTTTPKEAATG